MISQFDIQIAAQQSGIRLTPLARELVAVIFNAAIYEARRGNPLERNELILNFLRSDFPRLLVGLSRSLKVTEEISALDAIHWLIPKFPDQITGSRQLAFIFDKE